MDRYSFGVLRPSGFEFVNAFLGKTVGYQPFKGHDGIEADVSKGTKTVVATKNGFVYDRKTYAFGAEIPVESGGTLTIPKTPRFRANCLPEPT